MIIFSVPAYPISFLKRCWSQSTKLISQPTTHDLQCEKHWPRSQKGILHRICDRCIFFCRTQLVKCIYNVLQKSHIAFLHCLFSVISSLLPSMDKWKTHNFWDWGLLYLAYKSTGCPVKFSFIFSARQKFATSSENFGVEAVSGEDIVILKHGESCQLTYKTSS